MKKNTTTYLVAFVAAVFAVTALIANPSTSIMAEEEGEKASYKSANDIRISALFTADNGRQLLTDDFQVFEQKKGFDVTRENPQVELLGHMNENHALLYEVADRTYQLQRRGSVDTNSELTFDLNVVLHKDGTPLRNLAYNDCHIKNYAVDTLYDKEEGWTTSKGFALVDKFLLNCSGYNPQAPIMDIMYGEEIQDLGSESTFDLKFKDIETWQSHYKYPNGG